MEKKRHKREEDRELIVRSEKEKEKENKSIEGKMKMVQVHLGMVG